MNQANLRKKLHSKKYGVTLAQFTHHNNAILCASRNETSDHALRTWDVYENKFLHFYTGHTKQVVSLHKSPANDTFFSASLDHSARFWDMRSKKCLGIMEVPGRPVVAFDPQGMVFAVGSSSGLVKLYDPKNTSAPFATFTVSQHDEKSGVIFTHMVFSPDGDHLLVATNTNKIYLVDSFNGECEHTFSDHINNFDSELPACFSPDGQYVLSGSEDASIYVWTRKKGKLVANWQGHTNPVGALQWSPRRMLVASACKSVALWIPALPTALSSANTIDTSNSRSSSSSSSTAVSK
jgi:COMPASS component SWD2